MTCIVGLVHEGRVYIGGDSAGVAGYSLSLRADQKVFINGEFLMGFTSSFRMGQLLQYKLNPPKRHPDTDLMEYMVTDFVDGVRSCFKTGGYARKSSEEESGGTFLVGVKGRLFMIDEDYQVGEQRAEYAAVGCGADIALGALYLSRAYIKDPVERVKMALNAAITHSAGVSAPILVLSEEE